jgi:hypothetical protein
MSEEAPVTPSRKQAPEAPAASAVKPKPKPKPKKQALKKTRPRANFMRPSEWAEAMGLWEAGDMSLPQLARHMGVSPQALATGLRHRNCERGSRRASNAEAIRQEISRQSLGDTTVLGQRIRETKDQHFEWAAIVARLVMQEVAKAKQENRPMSSIYDNLKSLKLTAETLRIVREEKWKLLGLEDGVISDDELPKLEIYQMSLSEMEKIQKRASEQAANFHEPEGFGLTNQLDDVVVEDFDEQETQAQSADETATTPLSGSADAGYRGE